MFVEALPMQSVAQIGASGLFSRLVVPRKGKLSGEVEQRKCHVCSTQFNYVIGSKGTPYKFCSDQCRLIRNRETRTEWALRSGQKRSVIPVVKCGQCGIEFDQKTGAHKFCSRLCKVRSKRGYVGPQQRECSRCGTSFTTSQPTQAFCTRDCATRDWQARNPDKVLASRIRESLKIPTPKLKVQLPLKQCSICDCEFEPKAESSHICSRECELERGRIASRKHVELNWLNNAKTHTATCSECSDEFTYLSLSGPQDRKFCSNKCSVKASRRLRHSRIRAGAPSPIASGVPVKYGWIRHRDKWQCQVCGVHTPKSEVGGYGPNAPEIDHAIPLAKGGPHHPGNLWLLCRSCNCAKSDRLPEPFILSRLPDPVRSAQVLARLYSLLSTLGGAS